MSNCNANNTSNCNNTNSRGNNTNIMLTDISQNPLFIYFSLLTTSKAYQVI